MVSKVVIADTVDMHIAPYEIEMAQAGLVVTPVVLVAAVAIWLLLATGTIGRIVLLCEEIGHRRSAQAMVSGVRVQKPGAESPPIPTVAPPSLRWSAGNEMIRDAAAPESARFAFISRPQTSSTPDSIPSL